VKVVLVAMPELVDTESARQGLAQSPDIVLFNAEREALDWLRLQ
jgi:hypothetical protein